MSAWMCPRPATAWRWTAAATAPARHRWPTDRCGLLRLLHAIGNATLAQVVGRHFHPNPVAGKNANVVLAHAPGNMGGNDVPVVELDTEHGVGQDRKSVGSGRRGAGGGGRGRRG